MCGVALLRILVVEQLDARALAEPQQPARAPAGAGPDAEARLVARRRLRGRRVSGRRRRQHVVDDLGAERGDEEVRRLGDVRHGEPDVVDGADAWGRWGHGAPPRGCRRALAARGSGQPSAVDDERVAGDVGGASEERNATAAAISCGRGQPAERDALAAQPLDRLARSAAASRGRCRPCRARPRSRGCRPRRSRAPADAVSMLYCGLREVVDRHRHARGLERGGRADADDAAAAARRHRAQRRPA